jgi:hypothetical protein
MPRFPERASALERRVDPETAESQASVRPRAEVPNHHEPASADSAAAAAAAAPPAPDLYLGGLIDISEPAAVVSAGATPLDAGLGALDLLSQLDTQAVVPAMDNPLAGLEDFSSGVGRALVTVLPVQPTQDINRLFRKLLTCDSGTPRLCTARAARAACCRR